METAAVVCRGGLLAQALPGRRARARARAWGWGHGVGAAKPVARRRLLVASIGVGEPLPAHSLDEEVMAMEMEVDEDNDVASAETLPPPDGASSTAVRAQSQTVPAKTVRVKFVLQKRCAFGQEFLVVGDDPAIGLWNPAKATALDWSEGHVWTAKTDLRANKLIEFKFLLRDASGHVLWQHGANRTLRTTETPNTLVVHEDWDHAKKPIVSEEEELSIAAEDVILAGDLAGSNGAMLAHAFQTDQILETNVSVAVADASVHGEISGPNETKQSQFILDKDQKTIDDFGGTTNMAPQNGNPSADYDAGKNDDDAALSQEGLVLANRSTSIFRNDLAWARKALQRLLRSLGFQIGTTRT
ncbi:hypothetical protein ACP70R_038674 [Stipagrostis hirtigluma subsp. patula]